MWSYYWDEITDRITKCLMLWCLTNELYLYVLQIEFRYRVARYESSYEIYNKITSHSAISSTCVGSICLYLATFFPGSLDFPPGTKAPSFISKIQHAPWTRLCILLQREDWIAGANASFRLERDLVLYLQTYLRLLIASTMSFHLRS